MKKSAEEGYLKMIKESENKIKLLEFDIKILQRLAHEKAIDIQSEPIHFDPLINGGLKPCIIPSYCHVSVRIRSNTWHNGKQWCSVEDECNKKFIDLRK